MATQKQIAANRRNSLKSTGPRTASGKAITRMNALRHGLRAQPTTLSPEDLRELSAIRAEFRWSLKPQNPTQLRLIDRLAIARWHQTNWQRAEARFLADPSNSDPLACARAMDGFSRRQTRCQRAFSKAFDEYRLAPSPGESTL